MQVYQHFLAIFRTQRMILTTKIQNILSRCNQCRQTQILLLNVVYILESSLLIFSQKSPCTRISIVLTGGSILSKFAKPAIILSVIKYPEIDSNLFHYSAVVYCFVCQQRVVRFFSWQASAFLIYVDTCAENLQRNKLWTEAKVRSIAFFVRCVVQCISDVICDRDSS